VTASPHRSVCLTHARRALNQAPDPVTSEIVMRHGGTDRWQRRFVRFDPGTEPYCRLLYSNLDDPNRWIGIELSTSRINTKLNQDWHPCFGEVRWRTFPEDDALTTLPAVWSQAPGARVVRYRPGHRCTFETRSSRGHFFVKVFADPIGAPVHAASRLLWEAALAGQIEFRVPEPGYWDDETHALWQHALPGAPVNRELLSTEGPALATSMGRCAASLASSGLQFPNRFSASDQQHRTQRYVEELMRRLPARAAALDGLMSALRQPEDGPTLLAPIHGALHMHQWLGGAEGLGLVDFDRLCMGEPELDVATFLTEMDYEDRDQVPVAAIHAAFLAAYEARFGTLDHTRIGWYTAHKHLAKALKLVRGVRDDAEARAARAITRALKAVETLR
jgi:Phosphotransferase enzyme family